MGKKGLECLESIVRWKQQSGQRFFVVAGRDKAIANDYFEDLRTLANASDITFIERTEATEIPSAEVYFAIGWRWLIKTQMDKLIVFHDSLLPKYRGFNPLVTALIEGDAEIGVTAIKADREFDKGDVIDSRKVTVTYPIKIERAIDAVSLLYADLISDILSRLTAQGIEAKPQDENLATYSLWRDEQDYRVNWNESSERISRTIDAVGYPYNGAVTYIGGEKITIHESEIVQDITIVNRAPGKILMIEDSHPIVVCGSGLLKILHATDENGQKYMFNKLRVRLN
ncbi:formyltransferase family protein [Flavobacterium sp.]|uniref:methionyl-tRNA formyltransferase n=1 Tax=Flavobacterium sp. TaxID=239 RepID=UPI0025C44B3E|nr:formyltransferase family protein [Flavobacterium sp.]